MVTVAYGTGQPIGGVGLGVTGELQQGLYHVLDLIFLRMAAADGLACAICHSHHVTGYRLRTAAMGVRGRVKAAR